MIPRPRPQSDGYGSIRADQVLPVREAARRMAWGARTVRHLKQLGLRTVRLGRLDYVTGAEVVRFVAELADAIDP